jgi:PAS domain S-box-containing protein
MIYFASILALQFTSSCFHDHPVATAAALAVTLISGAVRLIFAWRVSHSPDYIPAFRLAILRGAAVPTTIAWGAYCAFVLYYYTNLWPSTYLLIAGASLAGGLTNTLAPARLLGSWVLVCITAPTAIVSILLGTPASFLLGISALGYLYFLLVQLGHNGDAFWNLATASAVDTMQSRQAATRSEIKFRNLFDDAPNGMYLAHPDGRLAIANTALAQMLGFTCPEDMAGRNLTEFRTETQADLLRRMPDRSGVVKGWESDWLHTGGRQIRVRESVRAVQQGGGDETICLQGTVEDVTERFLADNARRQLAEILEETTDFVETISLAGETLYLNRAGRKLLGPEAASSLKTSLWNADRWNADRWHADRDPSPERLRTAAEQGIWQGESWVMGATGIPVPVSQVIIRHLSPSGEPASFSIVSRDMSAVRAAQKALRNTEELLLQSQRLESLGRLAGGIAHDFNNLLTVIIGYGSVLQEQIVESEARSPLDEMCLAAGRAADLTRQLLAFGRKQVLTQGVVDLNQVVNQAERMLRRLIRPDIGIVVRTTAGKLEVESDGTQIEQMLLNLVLNARDAMPDGGTVTIETSLPPAFDQPSATGVDARRYVRIAVSDTGIGMDEETAARVFEPFFTTKGMGRGTGLGLATIYGFVKQSGGNILVTSKPGVGTTFEIYLLRAEGQIAGDTQELSPLKSRGTENILVVDDEPALRSLLRQTLAGHGYRVTEAANGQAALQVALEASPPFDLLVADVVMPGLTGPQLANRLRVDFPGIRVLFISGYPGETEPDRAAFSGDAGHLAKPFSAETLLRHVQRQLESGGSPACTKTAGY